MLAAIRMEVMTPSTDSPEEGCIGCLLPSTLLYLVVSFYAGLFFFFGVSFCD